MSLKENIAAAIEGPNVLAVALSKIARGRTDCGRPIAAEAARQLARGALTDLGLDWTHVLKTHEEMRPAFEQLKARRDRSPETKI